jgi:hypothetical protein
MKKLKVLIACEESQAITKAFRKLGHEAYSCDLQECSGGHPEWHYQQDVLEVIKSKDWDLMIAHPPCTYMSNAGARWMYPKAGQVSEERLLKGMEAKEFFLTLLNSDIPHIAVENPLPLKIIKLPPPTQIIQPYEYGDPYSKKTLLWLKNLPPLKATLVLKEYTPYLPSNTGGKKRGQKATPKNITQKESSKTFKGIAEAIAKQWSDYLLSL